MARFLHNAVGGGCQLSMVAPTGDSVPLACMRQHVACRVCCNMNGHNGARCDRFPWETLMGPTAEHVILKNDVSLMAFDFKCGTVLICFLDAS